jgi:pimeloyl-ACP methyl ester carboxylesterase
VWRTHDRLIPAGLARHVSRWVARAEQIVLEDCGHVPQVERSDLTMGLLKRFFAQSDALVRRPALAVYGPRLSSGG